VIGVDMTPEMVARPGQRAQGRGDQRRVPARRDRAPAGRRRHRRRDPVELRDQPVARQGRGVPRGVPRPAPGGRLAISDVVATAPIPAELQTQAAALAGCIAGAAPIDDVRAMLAAAGFEAIAVEITPQSAAVVGSWLPGIEAFVASATIAAKKPGGAAPCCGPSCCP
jgi:arsenite methyltransferase